MGLMNTHYAYLPIPLVIAAPRTVDPRGKQWNRLRAAIGQPTMVNDSAGGGSMRELDMVATSKVLASAESMDS